MTFAVNPLGWGLSLGAGSGGASGDAYFANVVALLHFDGPNNGTTFYDSSSHNWTVLSAAGAVTSSTQKKFGIGALKITTTGVTHIAYDSSFDVLANEFCVEFWFYPTANAQGYVATQNTASTYSPWFFVWNNVTSGYLELLWWGEFTGGGAVGSPNILGAWEFGPFSLNNWHFVQFKRTFFVDQTGAAAATDLLEFVVDGVRQAHTDLTHGYKMYPSSGDIWIGNGSPSFAVPFPGYIDEFRFTNGNTRDSTVPSAAFPGNAVTSTVTTPTGWISDVQATPTTYTGSATWNTDGSVTNVGNSSNVANWFSSVGGSPGTSYWIKFTSALAAPTVGGLSFGTIYALSSNRTLGWTHAGPNIVSGTVTATIYSDAGGSVQVATGTIHVDCESS